MVEVVGVLISAIIRWILTALLLWQVWVNSHWSVGLSLTLIFLAMEAYWAVKQLDKRDQKAFDEAMEKAMGGFKQPPEP